MSPSQNSLASVLMACVLALATTGCHAPWPIPDDDGRAELQPPTTPASTMKPPSRPARTTSTTPTPPPAAPTPQAATEPDLAGVLDKLEQVGQLDPTAKRKLMDELQRTEPRFWPAVAEQFRASLAYHQELVASKHIPERDNVASAEFDSIPPRIAADSRPIPAPPFRIPAPPSTPLGSLVDPRSADADGVASEALAHATPSAQKPPMDALDSGPNQAAVDAPAEFESAGPPLPIAAQLRPPAASESATSSAVTRASFNAPAPSAPTARAEDDSEKNWQQLVAEAADDLSRRVADSPATTAEIHQHVSLRILRLLAGQTEAALEPIPHIAPAEQDYWSRQIFALATYLDHHSQPDAKRRAAASATHLDEAVANLRDLGALSLRNFAFCKNVYGYGAIEPYKEDRFSSGQQVTLYVEVENYYSQSTEKGFTTSLGSTYEILDEKHERVDGGEFPNVDDCCRSRRRDFHIQFGLKLPEKIAPGHYQLELNVRDRQSDKIAHATAQFEVRGTVVSPPPKPSTSQ